MIRSWPLQVLSQEDRDALQRAAFSLFPFATVIELPRDRQGFCSYTLAMSLATDNKPRFDYMIQFRCAKYAIDASIALEATKVYGRYAPQLKALEELTLGGLGPIQATVSSTVAGVSYAAYRHKSRSLGGEQLSQQRRLVSSFADFVSRSLPADTGHQRIHACNGKVGAKMADKLRLLSHHLPTLELRSRAASALHRLHQLDDLPLVLTHGDTIPSNIMINPKTESIGGLIDWAEAEYLPFGTCLYGLEHFLGFNTEQPPSFTYYSGAPDLRELFWEELGSRIAQGSRIATRRDKVLLARDIGVLLWYGFAWDDGAIDRVVNAKDDPEDLMYLETFLGCKRSLVAQL